MRDNNNPFTPQEVARLMSLYGCSRVPEPNRFFNPELGCDELIAQIKQSERSLTTDGISFDRKLLLPIAYDELSMQNAIDAHRMKTKALGIDTLISHELNNTLLQGGNHKQIATGIEYVDKEDSTGFQVMFGIEDMSCIMSLRKDGYPIIPVFDVTRIHKEKLQNYLISFNKDFPEMKKFILTNNEGFALVKMVEYGERTMFARASYIVMD